MLTHVLHKAYITIAIRLRYDYDMTTTKNWHVHFLLASNGSRRAIRRSRIVVVSQSNRTQIVISITSVVVECVVVSSYRSGIANCNHGLRGCLLPLHAAEELAVDWRHIWSIRKQLSLVASKPTVTFHQKLSGGFVCFSLSRLKLNPSRTQRPFFSEYFHAHGF